MTICSPLSIMRGEVVSFESALSNPYYYSEGDDRYVYLMLKASAANVEVESSRAPMNIALVMDHSGSMNNHRKMSNVKKACELVVQNVQDQDKVSMVIYDDEVEVLHSGTQSLQKEALIQKISKVRPDGMTNLSGGLLEGYVEAKDAREAKTINRVLLLSDGLANRGIVETEVLQEIVSRKYMNEQIALSTFGVGLDF